MRWERGVAGGKGGLGRVEWGRRNGGRCVRKRGMLVEGVGSDGRASEITTRVCVVGLSL